MTVNRLRAALEGVPGHLEVWVYEALDGNCSALASAGTMKADDIETDYLPEEMEDDVFLLGID